MNEKELIKQMTEEFIIPNWYTPQNFGITNWSEERTQQFKDWFASKVCSHDPFREIMQEYIENFEQDIPYEDDEDEADSDEDDDETLDGDMEFDDKGYRIYWDAVEEDWVASEKFATKRFLDLLKSRPNFEGFDNGADDDTDEDECPPEPDCPPEPECTDEFRCEECTHCARTKPCSCGCGLLGGSCTIGYKMDNK